MPKGNRNICVDFISERVNALQNTYFDLWVTSMYAHFIPYSGIELFRDCFLQKRIL